MLDVVLTSRFREPAPHPLPVPEVTSANLNLDCGREGEMAQPRVFLRVTEPEWVCHHARARGSGTHPHLPGGCPM